MPRLLNTLKSPISTRPPLMKGCAAKSKNKIYQIKAFVSQSINKITNAVKHCLGGKSALSGGEFTPRFWCLSLDVHPIHSSSVKGIKGLINRCVFNFLYLRMKFKLFWRLARIAGFKGFRFKSGKRFIAYPFSNGCLAEPLIGKEYDIDLVGKADFDSQFIINHSGSPLDGKPQTIKHGALSQKVGAI